MFDRPKTLRKNRLVALVLGLVQEKVECLAG